MATAFLSGTTTAVFAMIAASIRQVTWPRGLSGTSSVPLGAAARTLGALHDQR
jgi:hypothetical protein